MYSNLFSLFSSLVVHFNHLVLHYPLFASDCWMLDAVVGNQIKSIQFSCNFLFGMSANGIRFSSSWHTTRSQQCHRKISWKSLRVRIVDTFCGESFDRLYFASKLCAYAYRYTMDDGITIWKIWVSEREIEDTIENVREKKKKERRENMQIATRHISDDAQCKFNIYLTLLDRSKQHSMLIPSLSRVPGV